MNKRRAKARERKRLKKQRELAKPKKEEGFLFKRLQDIAIRDYQSLKAVDPKNPILAYGEIDSAGRFHFTQEFYQKHSDIEKPSKDADRDKRFRLLGRATFSYKYEIHDELRRLGILPPLKPLSELCSDLSKRFGSRNLPIAIKSKTYRGSNIPLYFNK